MSILRYQNENYGSLTRIDYIPAWQVVSLSPLSKSHITNAGIQLLPYCDWISIYCSVDTMGHRQVQKKDANGELWEQQVVGMIPGDEEAIEAGLQQLHDQRYLLRVTRPNGIIRIIGTPKQPLDFTMDSNSQTNVPGTAGTSFQFGGNTGRRALILS